MYVKIEYRLEQTDNDGYCTNDECEHYVSQKQVVFPLDAIDIDLYHKYKNHSAGVLKDYEEKEWIEILPEPERYYYQSIYTILKIELTEKL